MAEEGTLHFLVHPGFGLAAADTPAYKRMYERQGIEEKADQRAYVEEEKALLAVYRRKIDNMGEGDHLVIFSPSEGSEYSEAVRKDSEWTRIGTYAKEKLGRRCVVLSNPDYLSGEPGKDSLETAGKILKQRGFEITPKTRCEVWGQTANVCVKKTADQAYLRYGLEEYPRLDLKATEKRTLRQQEIEILEQALRAQIPQRPGLIKQ